MRIIFCDSVIDSKLIEPDFESELTAIQKLGLNHSLISFEALNEGNTQKATKHVATSETEEPAIYRGWMLTPAKYAELYHNLLAKNIKLINTPQEYLHCHYLPESYSKIANKTTFSNWIKYDHSVSFDIIYELTAAFGNSAIILKDFVKSEKHNWNEACFIPNASDKRKVFSTVNKFLELRGNSLNEGLVFRKFQELEFLTNHSKSGMPLTKELRLFFANKKLISVFNYWDEGSYDSEIPELNTFMEIGQDIQSSFFSMDIAQKKTGEWIIIELGDGQVSGIPENGNPDTFYTNLMKSLL